MKNTKNFLPVAGGFLLILFLSGCAQLSGFAALNIIQNCEDSPTDEGCFCNVGFERIELTRDFSGTSYFCERLDKVFDPNDPNFAEAVSSHVSQKIQEIYPSCDMYACSTPELETEWKVALGTAFDSDNNPDKRTYQVDCDASNSLLRFGGARVDVVTGAVSDVSCGSYADVVGGQGSNEKPSEVFQGIPSSNRQQDNFRIVNRTVESTHWFQADCANESGIGTATFNVPRIKVDPDSWTVPSELFISLTADNPVKLGECEILTATEDYLNFKCDALCTERPIGSFSLPFKISASFLDSACSFDRNENPFHVINGPLNNGEFGCASKESNVGTTTVPKFDSVQCVNGLSTPLERDVRACNFINYQTPPVTAPTPCVIGSSASYTTPNTQRYTVPVGGSLRIFDAEEYVCGNQSKYTWDGTKYFITTPKYDVLFCNVDGTVTVIEEDVSACDDSGDRSQLPIFNPNPPVEPRASCNYSGQRFDGTIESGIFEEGRIISCYNSLIPAGQPFAGYYQTDEARCNANGVWEDWREGTFIATIDTLTEYNYRSCPVFGS